VIVELSTDDNNAMEPTEKSNLPEFRLIESAYVTRMTFATALISVRTCRELSNIATPFAMQIRFVMTHTSIGMAAVHASLFPLLI
jgi:hypothetical protein